jgi:ribosomal protein S6--L-glutamate ligase
MALDLISFDPYRCLDILGVTYLKPEQMFQYRDRLATADWILFPEEWQLNALHYGLQARLFPSVASYRFGQDKIQFTRALWMMCPEHVPDTLIVPATSAGIEQILERFYFPIVIKQPRSARGLGVVLVQDRRELKSLLSSFEVFYAQEYLEISRDLRVVWVGDAVMTAYWRHGGDGFHHNIACGGTADFAGIPDEPLQLVTKVAQRFNINYGGFDLAEYAGQWYFLEVNVRFGNAAFKTRPLHLGATIQAYLTACQPDPYNHPRHTPLKIA